MKKFLTLRRSMFVVALLTLAMVGMVSLWGGTNVRVKAQDATLSSTDLAYVESNTTFSVSSGSYSGGSVTFGLAGASADETTVSNSLAAADLAVTDAGCVAEGISEGAANASSVSVDTSGYSLPLQTDAYLPVSVSGVYSGTDVSADTSFSGTVLAHAGFSTTNPDFEMTDTTSTSVGVSYDTTSTTGGGGDTRLIQSKLLDKMGLGGSSFMPATILPTNFLFTAAPKKDKNYKLSFKKSSGVPGFTSGKVKNWKSNVPGTEDLANVSLVIDSSSIQYDAVSGTLNVKQKLHLKKAN